MNDYTYLKFKGGQDLPDLPVPVRHDRLTKVMRNGTMQTGALLDELDHFLILHPDYQPNYAELAGRLSYLAGMEMAGMGLWESASHYLGIGSRWCPWNASVRLNHAVALQLDGRFGEALSEYRQTMMDPDIEVSPLVTLLAARCCRELGQWQLGADLLASLVPLAPREPGFWDFLSEMKEKAAHGDDAPRRAPVAEPITEPAPRQASPAPKPKPAFCSQCGTGIQESDRFCRGCGKAVQ
jgi:hypothetical protein